MSNDMFKSPDRHVNRFVEPSKVSLDLYALCLIALQPTNVMIEELLCFIDKIRASRMANKQQVIEQHSSPHLVNSHGPTAKKS